MSNVIHLCIEGNPFITRFKTCEENNDDTLSYCGIEGNPFITRFKTFFLQGLGCPSVHFLKY